MLKRLAILSGVLVTGFIVNHCAGDSADRNLGAPLVETQVETPDEVKPGPMAARIVEVTSSQAPTEYVLGTVCAPVVAEIVICLPNGQAFMIRVTACSAGAVGAQSVEMNPHESAMFCGGV